MIKVAIDLDDLCLKYADRLKMLDVLKEEFPAFKITLFGIPMKMNDYLLKEVEEREYIRVAMHGWEHNDNMECNTWTNKRSIRDKMKYWKQKAKRFDCIDKGFKAPGWWISPEIVEILNELKWWVAVNPDNPTYNLSRPDKPYLVDFSIEEATQVVPRNAELTSFPDYTHIWRLHGHMQDTCNNGLEECFSKLCTLPDETEFYWISEVLDESQSIDYYHDVQ